MNERKPVLSAQAVHDLADTDPRIDGIGKARNLSRYIVEDSGSPMETAVALLLSLPVRRGGAGLPKPKMNGIVDLPADIRRLAQRSYLKADLRWRAKKVAVEYDSDLVQGNAKALNSDAARRNALCHLGYTVVTLTREQLFDWRRFEEFVAVLSRLLRSQPSRAKRDWTQQRFAVWSALLRANPQNACYMG